MGILKDVSDTAHWVAAYRARECKRHDALFQIEVDQENIINFKSSVLKDEQPGCNLQRISMDLSIAENRAELIAGLSKEAGKIAVLTEGVIPYLTEAQVSELSKDLRKCPSIQYWIVEYHSPHMYRHLQNRKKAEQMEGSTFQFFPEDWTGFFKENGWKEAQINYLAYEGAKVSRPFPLPWWAKILHRFLPKGERVSFMRMSGFMLLDLEDVHGV